jgi:hypothetical protein
LLVSDWRRAGVYGATLAVVGLPALYLLNRSSGGWFWTYVFKLHQQHDFYAGRAFVGSPVRIVLLIGPALLLIPWALVRARSPGLIYATFLAAAGAGAACLGFGTQWAFTNAFIPGIFFPAIAIGVAAGRLLGDGPRLRPHVVWALLALTLVIAPGGLLPAVARIAPRDWALLADGRTPQVGYDPRFYLPTADDRARGDQLLARLKAAPGEVLIPFHPFYGYLAGKRTWLHRMGVLDVGRAGLGAPRGLTEAIGQHRWSLVVMDDKIDGNWNWWPGLQAAYPRSEIVRGPRVYSGAQTEPRYALAPMLEP